MRTLFFVFLVVLCSAVKSQDPVFGDKIFRSILEDIREESTDEEMNMQTIEDLMELREKPFYINESTRSEWEKLIFLSSFQINQIMDFLKQNGPLYSAYQLQGVKGLDRSLIDKICLFVSFENPITKQTGKKRMINGKLLVRDMFTVETARGYLKDSTISGYMGDRQHLYSKLQMKYGSDLTIGLLIDKDPGEIFMQKDYAAVDFVSGYVMYEGKHILKRAVVGDFSVNWGQGLGIWTGTSLGKTSSTVGVMKKGDGIGKYSSANENQFFRGGALSLQYKSVNMDLFGSYKERDSDISMDKMSGKTYITSMPTTGYHRTGTELEKRKNLEETVCGLNVNYRYRNLILYGGMFLYQLGVDSVGYSYAYKKYAHAYPDSRFYWTGFKFGGAKCVVFGELAMDNEDNPAVISGMELNPAKNLSMSLLYRYYHDKYFSPLLGSLVEYSTPNGERGALLSIKFSPCKKVSLYGYMDVFSTRMLKYNMDRPSQGYEFNAELEYACNSKWTLKWKYKEKEKYKNSDGEVEADFYVVRTNLKRIRMESSYMLTKSIELRNRLESSFYSEDEGSTFGMLSYVELGYKMAKGLFTCWFRYVYFDTDDYESRIYTYEHDLLYNFYTPAFQDKGNRVYVSLKWRMMNNLDFWFKCGRTWYSGMDEIGSGLQTIEGNSKTNLKMQLQYKF